MRKGQMLNTVILVSVLLVALIGLWMIFGQGAGFGQAIAQNTVTLSATPGTSRVVTVNSVEYEVRVSSADSQTAVLSINGESVNIAATGTTTYTLINGQKISAAYKSNARKIRVRFI